MVTIAIGALIQHDASHHKWSPYAGERGVLITSIDDFSRKLLYADFFEQETTWAHIKAAESVMLTYGIPLRYYVDSLRVFRLVHGSGRILCPVPGGERESGEALSLALRIGLSGSVPELE